MRIYLAGPEVFLPNAIEVLGAKKRACTEYGHVGISPFDSEVGEIQNDYECGLRIAQANEELIDSCDVVIANISPFHGLNADPGTIYEIGYARGKGKLIFAYTYNTEPHVERISQHYFHGNIEAYRGFMRDKDTKVTIDDFGMVENAMIDGGIVASGGEIVIEDTEEFDLACLDGFISCLQLIPN